MSDQKNWDAALIKTWRTNANVGDALKLFAALSGKYVTDCDPPLKRIPPIGLPWYVGGTSFWCRTLAQNQYMDVGAQGRQRH